MSVVFLHLQQIQLYVPLGRQVNGFRTVLTHRNTIFLQILSCVYKGAHYVEQFGLRKNTVLQLFLLYRSLQSKIVVIAKSMDLLVLYTHLSFYSKHIKYLLKVRNDEFWLCFCAPLFSTGLQSLYICSFGRCLR